MSNNAVEQKALVVGAIINCMMAIAGWVAFYFSNSQAVLLDGNFSFIAFLTTLVAIRVSMIKAKKTAMFPFGQFVYEALFSFSKGIMIIGVLLMALTVNISRVFHYLDGEPSDILNTGVILIYTFIVVILCASLAFYCNHQNKKINYSSTILKAEYSGAKVDGYMSLATGLALFGIGFVNIEGSYGFLHYIGDALLVIILVLLLGKEPFVLVRNSFVELAGGTLQNPLDKKNIETILETYLSHNDLLKDSYISKTGSSYLVIAYVNTQAINELGSENMKSIKEKILIKLNQRYRNSMLEFVLA
jgi:divalent metal cation (Fe/Co/Zn/Cd) transporter